MTAMTVFGPMIAAAALQLVAVIVMTIVFYLLAREGYFLVGWPFALCDQKIACDSAVPLVRLSYLVTAAGVALTNNRLIAQTELWATNASKSVHPNGSRFSVVAVAVQLSVVTIACIVEELETPSQVVVVFGQWMGGIWLGAVLWPAIWSIVVAAAGSLVHALCLSARQR